MFAVVQIPFLVVAILLVRAVRDWATITLLVGTCCLTLATVIAAIAVSYTHLTLPTKRIV